MQLLYCVPLLLLLIVGSHSRGQNQVPNSTTNKSNSFLHQQPTAVPEPTNEALAIAGGGGVILLILRKQFAKKQSSSREHP